MSERPLSGRILLLAGAGRGLGAAVAREAARRGAHPVLLARSRGALEELDDRIRAEGGEATLAPLDLLDGDAVDRLGPSLFARFGRLDGFLFAAAELGTLAPLAHQDPTEVARVVGAGALAFQRLVRTLEPLLRRAPAARCVVVGDPIASAPRAYWGPYAAAKAALAAFALAWAEELERSPIRVVLVEPGPMATRLRRRAFPGEPPRAQPDPELYAGAICDLLAPSSVRHGERIVLQPARSSA
ncbi:MAG: SDR family NAD(P)-dependent oxidoreductase [Geminicoccaceae bacterium]|nr:SDR family NAD(P)-dependent oxidoreductase [Geminicoccaceae bacterium]MDW8341994.1 SDR family NAD(P)-dependent oxidoreductase [Geminicoccaceae bacterium]